MISLRKSSQVLSSFIRASSFSSMTTSQYHIHADTALSKLSDAVGALEDQLNDVDVNFTVRYYVVILV